MKGKRRRKLGWIVTWTSAYDLYRHWDSFRPADGLARRLRKEGLVSNVRLSRVVREFKP